MFKAANVANYIVDYSINAGHSITHLKLQKILYYVAAAYLQKSVDNKLLFEDEISKWQYGPVVENVYNLFKIYGSYNINAMIHYSTYNEGEWVNVDIAKKRKLIEVNDSVVSIINSVIDACLDIPVFDLVERTHQEPAWTEYKDEIMQSYSLPYKKRRTNGCQCS